MLAKIASVSLVRTDSRSLSFFRQLIAQLSSPWTDSGSLRLLSVLTASDGTPAVSRCFGQRVLDLLHQQWPRRESPDFPAHSGAERPNSAAERQSSSAPHRAKLACVTDICPAESGGSHRRSTKRCVVGSPDFWAERSSVGSHLGDHPLAARRLAPGDR